MSQAAPKRAMIWFESHLGAGDAKLSFNLAEGLARNGYEVYLVSSSIQRWQNIFTPNEHIHAVNLPELERGQDNVYRTPTGTKFPDDKAYVAKRTTALTQALDEIDPDLVVTQSWPIGRDHFDEEMLELVKAAKNRSHKPLLACYPCDAIFVHTQNGRQGWRQAQFVDELKQYDSILVPGNDLLDFTKHLPPIAPFADKIHYSGYMVEDFNTTPSTNPAEVIVCSGGGWHNSDMPFYEAVIKSRKYTELSHDTWCIKVSRRLCSDEKYAEIVAWAYEEDPTGEKIIVEAADDKFQQQMVDSKMLLVRSGYNTLTEAVHARKHVVTFPRPYIGGDKEQQERALALQTAGYMRAVTQPDLEALVEQRDYAAIATVINQSLHDPVAMLPPLETHGADNAARYFTKQIEARTADTPHDDVTAAHGELAHESARHGDRGGR